MMEKKKSGCCIAYKNPFSRRTTRSSQRLFGPNKHLFLPQPQPACLLLDSVRNPWNPEDHLGPTPSNTLSNYHHFQPALEPSEPPVCSSYWQRFLPPSLTFSLSQTPMNPIARSPPLFLL
ncbi:hypothetical protein GOODEAATRI_019524 [Goodea atripinnis]|uniref:Uncharacterized protein n=1 Tax=Goodea atripinnis TaxID=208336 RepID=A0ABV0PFE1_9TELE